MKGTVSPKFFSCQELIQTALGLGLLKELPARSRVGELRAGKHSEWVHRAGA